MRFRLIALCFGLALTPGFAVTAHATYTFTLLQAVGGAQYNYNQVLAINSLGESVGSSCSNGGPCDAVVWLATGTPTVLAELFDDGAARAINASGESAGSSHTMYGHDAVLWSPSGQATVLKDPGGQGQEFALAINDSGKSVGYADIAGGGTEAVLGNRRGRRRTSARCWGQIGPIPRPWRSTM